MGNVQAFPDGPGRERNEAIVCAVVECGRLQPDASLNRGEAFPCGASQHVVRETDIAVSLLRGLAAFTGHERSRQSVQAG